MKNRKKRRYFTLLIIPHTEESVLSIRIPLFLLQGLSVIVIAGLIGGFFWFNSYQSLQQDAADISVLRDENRSLNEDIDLLAKQTEELRVRLEELRELEVAIRSLIDLPERTKGDEVFVSADPVVKNYDARVLASRDNNQVIERTDYTINYLQESIPVSSESLTRLKRDLEEYQREKAATPSIWPSWGRVTSEFGPRTSPITRRREFHYGIDIAAPRGTPIYATADGKVTVASYRRGYGNVIHVSHSYNFRTVYAHLSSFNVSVGDEVKKGQIIGYMGSTGSSTGVHLHYEVHYNGVAVNPRNFLP